MGCDRQERLTETVKAVTGRIIWFGLDWAEQMLTRLNRLRRQCLGDHSGVTES